ncbi:MAG: HAMP domain-containing protein [Gammaproteobacteria bacterium]|nr:HAMP domain-containing protein [Gammaproteobacteria bacterium]
MNLPVKIIQTAFRSIGVTRIKPQLLILNILLLVIGLAAGGSVYMSVQSDAATINMAGQQRMLSQRIVKETLMVAQGVGDRAMIEKTASLFVDSHNKLLKGDPAAGINRSSDQTIQTRLKKIKVLWQNHHQELSSYLSDRDTRRLPGILEASNLVLKEMNQTVQLMEARSKEAVIVQAWYAVFMVMLILFFSFLIFLFVSNRLVGPIIQLEAAFERGARGDFSQSLPIGESKDEMASAFQSYNAMTDSFSNMVGAVVRSAASVGTESSRLSSASQINASGMLSQYQQIEQVSTAMNELSATVQEVAQNITHAAEHASQANLEAVNSREVMGNASQSIEQLNSQVEVVSGVISHLDTESQEIGKVLDVINGIAEQTNLLALNAAIEAARAGEQGRGFAVVADEVRALAARTRESTQEIQTMIQQLQTKVQEAVTAIDVSLEQAGKGVTQVVEADASLNLIAESISTINEMNTQIATAAEEQSLVTEDMNKRIVEIAELAKRTRSSAEQNLEAAGRIASGVGALGEKSSHFKTEDDGLELELAKSAHLAWIGKLRTYLDGNGGLTKEQATSHHHCILGKWYYTEGLKHFGHLPEMKALEAPHEKMHNHIQQIIELKESGKSEEAEIPFSDIEPLSAQIISLLEAIQQKIDAKRNGTRH